MIEAILEEPIAAGHQLADRLGSRRFLFAALNLGGEPLVELIVQRPHQPFDAVFADFRRLLRLRAAHMAPHRGDRAANAEAFQDQVEAFARVNAVMIGDLD